MVSSTQMSSTCTDVLPVLKTQAVLAIDARQAQAATNRRYKTKPMSMDEIGLWDQLYGRFRYPTFKKDEWQTKQTVDGTGMIKEEGSEAKELWQENYQAKFILQMMPWELSPLAPMTPFNKFASVPFKWEDAPGKPKPDAVVPRQNPRLQLPPRLYARQNSLPLPEKRYLSQVKRIFLSILPAIRARKASKSNLQKRDEKRQSACVISREGLSPNSIHQKRDEKRQSACVISREGLSPNSILQGFDAQSQASSTSPDNPSPSNRSLACSSHRQFAFRDSSREPPFSSSNNSITPYISTCTVFEPEYGTKGSRHLHLAVENIKEAVRSFNINKIGGKRKHRSMDFDTNAEVWSPTLAVYYQQYIDEANGIENVVKDQTMNALNGDETTTFNPKLAVQPVKQFNVDQTISSPGSLISTSGTTKSEELSCRTKRSRLKWILNKMQKSYSVVVQYRKTHSK